MSEETLDLGKEPGAKGKRGLFKGVSGARRIKTEPWGDNEIKAFSNPGGKGARNRGGNRKSN